ncbi:MAG: LysE family transporter [Chlamydiales bacterium]|nr:LysE family transporter [Chlamydiales bacterium]
MDIAKVLSIALISLLGAMSPGPDFAIVTRNCISGTFRSGFLTTLGITTALFVHISYCLFGIALLIMESSLLFHILKYLGAGYLFYLGIILLKEKVSKEGFDTKKLIKKKHSPFVSGFLCNILNPKATLFVLSLFTQFIDPNMSFLGKAMMGSIIAITGLVWFSLLSFLITHRLLQKHFARFQMVITKVMGVLLCGLATYIAFLS